MKSHSTKKFSSFYCLIKNKRIASFLSVFLTLSFLNLVIGCSYYNVRSLTTTQDTIASQITEFSKNQNYVIIHSGQEIWNLSNLVINENEKSISGVKKEVSELHIPKKPREIKRTHRYSGSKEVLNEVHFYISSRASHPYGEQATIKFEEINSISVNDKNTGKTVLNIAVGVVGTLALVAIIALLTKSSCPFVYVKNGEEFVFTGELYPGVLTPNQQRDDYLGLPNVNNINNEVSIKITNELKEIQYTDFVQLIEIPHSNNLKILLDKNGDVHTFSEIITPNKIIVDQIITGDEILLENSFA